MKKNKLYLKNELFVENRILSRIYLFK